jgi:hypothetical protein
MAVHKILTQFWYSSFFCSFFSKRKNLAKPSLREKKTYVREKMTEQFHLLCEELNSPDPSKCDGPASNSNFLHPRCPFGTRRMFCGGLLIICDVHDTPRLDFVEPPLSKRGFRASFYLRRKTDFVVEMIRSSLLLRQILF